MKSAGNLIRTISKLLQKHSTSEDGDGIKDSETPPKSTGTLARDTVSSSKATTSTYKPHEPRICVFDIETTNLKADFGTVICASWLWWPDPKIHTLKNIDYPSFQQSMWDDRALVRDISAALSEADMWVTWYGRRFDERFLNTRLLFHGLPPMAKVAHWDGWRTAKYRLALSSNRLANVAEFLQLASKTPLKGGTWVRARYGHLPSIRYVVRHCEQDVRVLAAAYEKLRPFSEWHPHIGLMTDRPDVCPYCGSARLRSRGWKHCQTLRYRRFRCLDCGGVCRGSKADKAEPVEYRTS